MMKPTAIIVNTGRGAVIDEPAMVQALQEGKLAGAGLDVFTAEPLSQDSPLCSLENVVLSPHVGAMSPETSLAGLAMALDNIENFLAGTPTNTVSRALASPAARSPLPPARRCLHSPSP